MNYIKSKEMIFTNECSFKGYVNAMANNKGSKLIVTDVHNVKAGRGYSKSKIYIDVCLTGEWIVTLTVDMSNYSLTGEKTLGKYSKQQTENMISKSVSFFYDYIVNGFYELDGTNEIIKQKERAEKEQKEYIQSLSSFIYDDFLYNEEYVLSLTPDQYYNEFINNHNVTDEDIKEILFSKINRKYKRLTKENNITAEQTNTTNQINTIESYKVGNRTFSTYSEAETYCNESDFVPELMIIKEAANTEPLESQNKEVSTNEPEVFHLYKNTFNTYIEAYNYALNNRIPVTMIISSKNKTMNNERLQELEKEYVFNKTNMSIEDINEYYNYLSILPESLDRNERYYKLKSYIERYKYKHQSKREAENKRQQLSLEGSRLLVFMKEKGLELKLTKEYQWYYYKGEHVYSFYSCSVEKYYNDMKELFNKYFSEYEHEYNNSIVYYYKGNDNTCLSMEDYPKGWISYNHNTYIAAFNRQLTNKEQIYYNLIPEASMIDLIAM